MGYGAGYKYNQDEHSSSFSSSTHLHQSLCSYPPRGLPLSEPIKQRQVLEIKIQTRC